jgi:hypothetical protein
MKAVRTHLLALACQLLLSALLLLGLGRLFVRVYAANGKFTRYVKTAVHTLFYSSVPSRVLVG